MSDDWRLRGQEAYLLNATLRKVCVHFPETEDSKAVDHMHCSFCWAKMSNDVNDLHEGYLSQDGYQFICDECYNDFKDRFQWKLFPDIDNKSEDI